MGSVEGVRQVSTSAPVLLTNALLALGLLVLIPFPSELFDSTLKAHSEEVRRWFRFIPRGPGGPRAGAGRVRRWMAFSGFTLAAAALYSLLDPGLGLGSPSLALYLGLTVALIVVTLGFNLPGILHLRAVHGEAPRLRMLPWTLPIAAVCVAISRVAGVHPGYVYGLLAAYTFEGEFSERAEGRAVALSTAVLFGISIVAWLAWTPIKAAAEQPGAGFGILLLDAMLAMIFVVGLETMAFGLVPLRFLDGEKIVAWSRLAWAALFGAGVFGLLHVLLDPRSGYLAEARGGVVTLILLFVGFGAASVTLWAYFRFRPAR
ncbi:MAG TPA: FGLLP motif-containing membrane protein [Candidatus Dormibacteraeota bacterium]